jgi:hypothetical protein
MLLVSRRRVALMVCLLSVSDFTFIETVKYDYWYRNTILDDLASKSVCIYSIGQVATVYADDSWVLWNATTALEFTTSEYFCCLPGQIGCQDGTCVEPDTYSTCGVFSAAFVCWLVNFYISNYLQMSLGLRDHLSWWWCKLCNCNGDYNEGQYR